MGVHTIFLEGDVNHMPFRPPLAGRALQRGSVTGTGLDTKSWAMVD